MSPLIFIQVAKIAVTILICVSAALLVRSAMNHTTEFAALSRDIIQKKIDGSEQNDSYFNKDRLTSFLSEQGVMYRKNDYELDPVVFIFEKIMIGFAAALGMFIVIPGFSFKIVAAIVAFLAGFFYPDIRAKQKNKADNLAMEDDIITIYSTLKTEAKAGMYIGDSLIDCQRSVTNKRLKMAMTELNNNILSRKITMEEAVMIFKSRFDNPQIEDLADIIRQSFRTGKLIEMTKDIGSQIADSNEIRYENEKNASKKFAMMINIAFFSGIVILVLYISASQLGNTLMSLW